MQEITYIGHRTITRRNLNVYVDDGYGGLSMAHHLGDW